MTGAELVYLETAKFESILRRKGTRGGYLTTVVS
jgi:hypothetical protein